MELLGPANKIGTGMLPAHSIIKTTPRIGIPDAIGEVYVRHEPTGGMSYAGFKSYDQKRKSFQGTAKEWILNDEEPPIDVYIEELMRLMTTNGVMLNTFTPMSGLSDVVLSFLPGGKSA
jgi:phage terminase large subunit-like protein